MSDCNGCTYYNKKCNLPKYRGCSNRHIVDEIYQQGGTDAIDEFDKYLKKNFKIGINTIDDVVKEFKEQWNEL